MSALLHIENLHVAYGKVEAVRGVALTMQPGQIVTVIGPNGAGKTTLLAAAAGLLRSRGKVIYDGVDVARLDVEERVERGFCLVPESREFSVTWPWPIIFCSAPIRGAATGPP